MDVPVPQWRRAEPRFDVDGAENFMNAVAAQGDLELTELAQKMPAFASE